MAEFGIDAEALAGIVEKARGIAADEVRVLFENNNGDEISLAYELIPKSELEREWNGF